MCICILKTWYKLRFNPLFAAILSNMSSWKIRNFLNLKNFFFKRSWKCFEHELLTSGNDWYGIIAANGVQKNCNTLNYEIILIPIVKTYCINFNYSLDENSEIVNIFKKGANVVIKFIDEHTPFHVSTSEGEILLLTTVNSHIESYYYWVCINR